MSRGDIDLKKQWRQQMHSYSGILPSNPKKEGREDHMQKSHKWFYFPPHPYWRTDDKFQCKNQPKKTQSRLGVWRQWGKSIHRNHSEHDGGYCPLASWAHKPLRLTAPFLACSVPPLGCELPSAVKAGRGQNKWQANEHYKTSSLPTFPVSPSPFEGLHHLLPHKHPLLW